MEKAAFAAGCFWAAQDAFDNMPGVVSTTAGYSGGDTQNPTYREVSSGRTGHAETIEITYDPRKVAYEQLLKRFWEIHNPTTLNRQGPDIGTQYRSMIFYYDSEQKKKAEKSLKKEQRKYGQKIVTEIKPMEKFWPAEDYHQNYVKKRAFIYKINL